MMTVNSKIFRQLWWKLWPKSYTIYRIIIIVKGRKYMNNEIRLWDRIKLIMTGQQLISTELKYRFICIVTSMVHLVFCVAMHIMKADFLFMYNMCIVIFYCYMGSVLVSKEKYRLIIILFFLEVELHSSLASILLGWDYNFMLYTVALVPAAFYLNNSPTADNKDSKSGFLWTVALSLLVVVCYFAMSLLGSRSEPLYDMSSYSGVKTAVRAFNIFIAFLIQFVFSLFFAMETSYMGRLLAKENVKLGEEASFDPLTGLLNRRSLITSVSEEIGTMERVDRFSIVMLDIDNFKSVNDTYGHDVGDTVLVALAKIITNEIREGDYACRWGGEEFLLFAHGSKYDTAHAAERIRNKFAETVFNDKSKGQFSVTVTMGIAEFRYGMQFRDIVEIADKRLYYGKTHGKNQVVYE